MTTPDRILATCKHIHCVGSRPTSERAAWARFKQVARAGLLGTLMMVAGGQAVAAQGGAQAPVSHQQATQAVMVVKQHQAKFVDGVLDGKHDWVASQGTVDLRGLLRHWREAGIDTDRIFELTKVMLLTQSPTIARTPAAEAAARQLAQDTMGIFQVHNDGEAISFLNNHSLEALVDRGVLKIEAAVPYDVLGDGDFHSTLNLLEQISYDPGDTGGWQPAASAGEDAGMPQAKQALLEAVDQAGLAGLTVPLPYWTSSQKILTLADQVVQANRDMQAVTGWQGPVLGLNGRVNLSIGQPFDMAVTYAQSQSGQDTMIHVMGGWENIGHELTHAIDMAMRMERGLPALHSGASKRGASEAGVPENSRTLTEALELGQVDAGKLGELSGWGHLNQQLKAAGAGMKAPWHDQVDVMVDRMANDGTEAKILRDYFTRSWEQVAYAFSAYSDYVLQDNAQSVLAGAGTNHDGVRTPSMEEAQAAAPVWQRTMEMVGQQWWGPQMLASVGAQHGKGATAVLASTEGNGLASLLAQRRAGQAAATPKPEMARAAAPR